MARRDLSRLLRPRSIVAVGGEWAANVVEQCRRMKYRGKLWAVNPRRKKLFDAKCFGSLRELPAPPDAVFLGVNREATVEAVAELAAMGGGGAVCFASGFAEADGRELQNKLVAAAGCMPVLGPNCYGLINFLDGAPLWPDQHGGMRATSGAAIVAQSSNILINLSSQRRGLPLAYLAAAGNQAQTSAADIARGFLADKRVRAVGFYLEGIVDAADFAGMAAQAESQNIPLVALKAGKCPQSAAAAKTHTDAITGGGAASSAFLRRCNIAEAETLDEMLEMLKLLQTAGRLRGRRIMSLSCSGGEAGHIADLAAERRLCFPPPPPKPKAKLQKVLGKRVTIANPLDYHTYIWRDPAALYAAYRAAFDCGADLTTLIYDYPRADRCDWREWREPMQAFMRAAADSGRPAAVAATLAENMPEDIAAELWKQNIAPLCGLPESLAAMEAAADSYKSKVGRWRPLPPRFFKRKMRTDEAAAKQWLAENGIAVPRGGRADSPKQAAAVANMLRARHRVRKFAVKSLALAHKTDSGGVRLNLAADEVEKAAKTMPGNSFLVEAMVEDAVAELLVGVRADDAYGATLTVAAGGVHAEIFADSQTLILPVKKSDVIAAIKRLKLSPLFLGARGRPKADIESAAAAACKIAALFQSSRFAAEIEINPLLLRGMPFGGGAIAADALVYAEKTKGEKT